MTGFNSKREAAADKLQETVEFDTFLESQDFYELMQTYRHCLIDAFAPFEAVKSALRAAHIKAIFAQPAQEPVAWGFRSADGAIYDCISPEAHNDYEGSYNVPLYTTPPLPAQPAQEPEMLTIAYQSGFYDGKKSALAGREWNFCERCGKRTKDLTVIHTCTPPQEKNL